MDAGLDKWAEGVPKRAAVRAAISAHWPIAEEALQRFYSDTYGVRPDVALQMARFALDTIYRGNFTFSRSATANPDDLQRAANPWPANVR